MTGLGTDEDGVLAPRLRLGEVVLRGALFGLCAVPVVSVPMLFVSDHSDRVDFLGVVGILSLLSAGVFLFVGRFFWLVCMGDIRRCRDWRTVTGQSSAPTVAAPVLARLGTLVLVLGPAALGLSDLVDRASFDSWLYVD